MIDIKKILETTSLQLVILIVLGLVSVVIMQSLYSDITTIEELYAASSSPLSMLSWLISIASLAVTAWAGYVWVRQEGGTAVDGGKAGAVLSAVTGFINGIISVIFLNPVMTNLYQAAGVPQTSSMMGVMAVISIISGVIVSAIIGFILGAIGGHFGKKKK